jgi:tetratricopeptide (TPR) repeat protein
MWFCLLVGLSLAQSEGPIEALSPASSVTPTLTAPYKDLSVEDLRADIQARLDRRDLSGVAERIAYLRGRDGAQPDWLYLEGFAAELAEDYPTAIRHYLDLQLRWPDSPRARDAHFREALCLGDLGRHEEALREVRAMQRLEGLNEDDELTLALERGRNELGLGRERRGRRHIEGALEELEGSDRLRWMRARAHVALADQLLRGAAQIELVGDEKAARRLKERVELIAQAEQQVIAASKLREPELLLRGFLVLGLGYEALYRDVSQAPPPRQLDPEQVQIYQRTLAEHSEAIKVKAWRYYEEGYNLAISLSWPGQLTQTLASRRDALGLRPGQ